MKSAGAKVVITNKTKGKLPRLPFQRLKDAVLGKDYELSVVFVTDKLSQELNRTWREKDKPTNILSFPLSKTAGEIFIAPAVVRREAPSFDRNVSNFTAFLFIHGLFHLKGFDHGGKMEDEEAKVRKQFSI